jgi:hypothetical protein
LRRKGHGPVFADTKASNSLIVLHPVRGIRRLSF